MHLFLFLVPHIYFRIQSDIVYFPYILSASCWSSREYRLGCNEAILLSTHIQLLYLVDNRVLIIQYEPSLQLALLMVLVLHDLVRFR
jgi:hypothetical protein